MRSRLESPARRRNSSAESPGPSNVMSVVQRALQPALQPPMHPPLQSQLHSRLEMQSYSHLCLAKLCIPVGNRASLPALKPAGQSAADSPKGSRQVLADVPGHLEPEQRSAAATVSRRIAFHEGERIVRNSTRSVRQLSLLHTLTSSRVTPSQILSTTYM